MGEAISYGNWVIHMQSFELMSNGGWIPRFSLSRSDGSLLCRGRLDKVFTSKEEADEFALGDAMDWIDNDEETGVRSTASS